MEQTTGPTGTEAAAALVHKFHVICFYTRLTLIRGFHTRRLQLLPPRPL
jgi:hypothetical protein